MNEFTVYIQSGENTRDEEALTPTDRPGIPGKQTHIYSDRKKES